jgi:hypothetical protein
MPLKVTMEMSGDRAKHDCLMPPTGFVSDLNFALRNILSLHALPDGMWMTDNALIPEPNKTNVRNGHHYVYC